MRWNWKMNITLNGLFYFVWFLYISSMGLFYLPVRETTRKMKTSREKAENERFKKTGGKIKNSIHWYLSAKIKTKRKNECCSWKAPSALSNFFIWLLWYYSDSPPEKQLHKWNQIQKERRKVRDWKHRSEINIFFIKIHLL